MDEVIIKYKAEIDGYKAELEDLKKADKNTRAIVEKPIEVTASTKSLRTQLKEAQADVARLSDKFGVTSVEVAKAAKRAAELKDAIGDAKALTDAFNPDAKFNALTSSLGGVVGGFQAYEGALALVGSESEDLQKTLVKLQALMALSQGLQQLGEARDSFKQLGAVIKSTTVFQTLYNAATRTATAVQTAFGVATTVTSTGFKVLRGAIMATGIGALVVALGLVIANFDAISSWIKKSPLGSFANQVRNLVQRFTDFVGVTSQAERNLEKISKANARANEGIKNKIDLLKAQGGSEKEIYQLSKQLNENELSTLRSTLAAKGKLNEEEAKSFRDLKNSQKVLDAEYQAKVNEDAKKAAEKRKEEAKKQLEDDRKQAIESEKKKAENLLSERDKLIESLNKKPIEEKRAEISRMQASNQDPKLIEKAQQELLKLETDFNQKKYQIELDFIGKQQSARDKATADAKKNRLGTETVEQIADLYKGAIQKSTEDAKSLNEEISKQIDEYKNKELSIQIQTILDKNAPKDYFDEIDKREKEITKRKTTSKLDELEKERDLINIQNERYAMERKLIEDKKAELDKFLVSQNIDPKLSVDSINFQKEIDALNNKISENSNVDVNLKIDEQKGAKLKAQIDELFAFASNGLFVQLGLNPNSVANFKSQVEAAASFLKQANDKSKSAEEQQKARGQATIAITQAASTAALAGLDMLTSSEKAASEQRIAQLNTEKEAELAAAGDNEQKKEIIRQKYDQKIKAEKRKQFEADKRASILRVVIATAEAVIRSVVASPTTGGLPFSAIAAAIGAAQIALIASQPTPKFKDGVVGFNGVVGGVGTGTSDSNLAWLSKGESVIPAQATGQNLGLVTSLVNGDVDKYIKSHYILPAIEQKEAEVIQTSQKRIDDIESKLINRTISRTLEAMRKDNKVNTAEIVTAIKKDKFTL